MTTQKITSDACSIPMARTSVYEAIFGRRMTKEFADEPVRREALENLFAAAVWAPNHRLTEPWRFFVIEKDSPTRQKVAQLAWEAAYERVANPSPDQKRQSADASRKRILDAPALVYAYCVPGPDDETTQENYAAVCCAVQNIALAAVAEGLGLDWSTGAVTRHPRLSETLGGQPDWKMVGALFIGVPEHRAISRRSPSSASVFWL